MSLAETIKHEARSLGFDAVGIAAINPQPTAVCSIGYKPGCAEFHGTMGWIAATRRGAQPPCRLPGCRSIIAVGMNYDSGYRATEGQGYGRIAATLGEGLSPHLGDRLALLEANCMNGRRVPSHDPMWTRAGDGKGMGQQAGLGWIGKHSNLVSADHGSWLVLGEILTTIDLPPDTPATDLCGSCSLCIQACPLRP
jgi:epoxyqueuosine reductase